MDLNRRNIPSEGERIERKNMPSPGVLKDLKYMLSEAGARIDLRKRSSPPLRDLRNILSVVRFTSASMVGPLDLRDRRNMLSEVLLAYESSDEGPLDLRDLRNMSSVVLCDLEYPFLR